MKKIYYLILFISMLVLAGCGQDPDCSTYNSKYEKYGYNSEIKSCEIITSIPKNKCGNGIIEDKETFCNCPEDVPKEDPELGCFGTFDNYIENSCNLRTKECGFYQNDKVVDQTRSLDFKNSDITLNSRITLGNPFVQFTDDNNKVNLDLEVFEINSDVKISNIEIKSILIEGTSTGTLYADIIYNQKVTKRGDKLVSKQVELSAAPKYNHKEQLRLTLVVTYTRGILDRDGQVIRSEDKVERLVASLGNWDIINPNLK